MSTRRDIAVRQASQADIPAVQGLFEQFYAEEGFAEAVERISTNLPQLINREDTEVFVAEDAEGTVIGAAAMSTAFGLEVGSYAEIEDLYVVPAWRGRGIAGAMVEHCVNWAAKRGCTDVEVVVTPESPRRAELIDWYARRGFRNTGRVILERDTGAESGEMYA
ncbi:MAG: GNAT family N-acetyltransferase [Rhodospirillales bacterium]|nr:GNAT family N-acetyltransferase [Rhodospirillales bacterium]MBO6785983.1 GNAT family N-acetyltransferase [Rhodospirillales bacterium]